MFDRVLNKPLDYSSCFYHGSKRDTQEHLIYAKLIIVFVPSLEMEVQHLSKQKVNKG